MQGRGYMQVMVRAAGVVAIAGALSWISAGCDAPPPGPTPPPPAPAPDPAPVGDRPIGFAGVSSLGQNGTTGGAGGPVILARTTAEFMNAVARSGPAVVMIDGTIALPGDRLVDVASDKTILGVGARAVLTGGGLQIGLRNNNASFPANAIHNVIVRNVSITSCPDDCINIQEFSHHIWIDHNDISRPTDGALDIKRGADFITVSWNHFFASDKNSLLGHSDNNASQDVGRLKVTYHNNWFDGTVQRNPRVRFGEPVHVFNNYYLNVRDYGVASQQNVGVLVEGNFFENSSRPTRNDVGGGPGRIVQRQNVFRNSDPPFSSGSVMEPSRFYRYTLEDPNSVPQRVRNGAGVGRIGR